MVTSEGRRTTRVLLAAAMAASTLLAVWGHGTSPSEAYPPVDSSSRVLQGSLADRRPNIVLITTDDMNKADLRWMPKTRRLLKAEGVDVSGFISNHPLCCPARAEIFTGQHGHNNGVHDNGGPYGGYEALRSPGNHIGAWLRAAGYNTAFVGKHLNWWEGRASHQAGWTVFDPILRGVYAPYGLTMFNNGNPQYVGGVHTSDLIGRRSTAYIKRFSSSRAPFFIWTSQVAPHDMEVDGHWGPPVPAARHATIYPAAKPPSLLHPAFNEDDVRDKPGWIRRASKVAKRRMIILHRARVRSLASVDDQVARTVRVLKANGELRNTYLFFTSDNGFLLGEHRLINKNKMYEESLRVPLLVRGPGLPHGVTRAKTYSLVDLAPTFLELGRATPGRRQDGRSMMRSLRENTRGYAYYLIQAALGPDSVSTGPAGGVYRKWWWRGVRSRRYVYIRYDYGFEELYDLVRDPAQLRNVARRDAYRAVRREYAGRLARLKDCAGVSCRRGGS